MRARARASRVTAATPATPAGRHEKASDPPEEEEEEEEEFDYGQPLEIDIGRAAVIAECLRESGYPRCTADVVAAELARPGHERGIIGRFAAGQLRQAGWLP